MPTSEPIGEPPCRRSLGIYGSTLRAADIFYFGPKTWWEKGSNGPWQPVPTIFRRAQQIYARATVHGPFMALVAPSKISNGHKMRASRCFVTRQSSGGTTQALLGAHLAPFLAIEAPKPPLTVANWAPLLLSSSSPQSALPQAVRCAGRNLSSSTLRNPRAAVSVCVWSRVLNRRATRRPNGRI